MMKQVWGKCAIALAAALIATAGPVQAQSSNYPTKPIRLIVPFAPGGGTDIMARVVAQKASEAFNQSVVVDNRPGGGGTVGAALAVHAVPDGYTLIMVSGSYGANAAIYNLPYDPVKDVTPIALIGESGFLLSVHPSLPVKNVKELIAYDKANPGKLNYGSTGTGGITHLASEFFNITAGTHITHVPYKGTGPALNDLLGGQIQLMFGAMPALIPHVKAGRLRGLGVTTRKRNAAIPDIPSISETVPAYDAVLWYALLGPKGLPKNVVALWNKEVNNIVTSPEMKQRMAAEGLQPAGGPPAHFEEVLNRDVAKWRKVVQVGHIQTERK